jgi:hypothetical protein
LNRRLHEDWKATQTFIKETFKDLPKELLEAQCDFMYSPEKLGDYNYSKTYNSNWFAYLKGHRGQVTQGETKISFEHQHSETLDDHLERLYFRRRFGYGKYIIT